MAFDPDKFLNLDLSFPGFSFGYESWAIDTYIRVLQDNVSFAKDQYRLRARRELERRAEELHVDKYGEELATIADFTEIQIPRFFWNSALPPIWGLFESFVQDITIWVGRRERAGLLLRDVRAENFRTQVDKYFKGVLQIDLPWTSDDRERLAQLQHLRNFLSHRNGRIVDLPPEKEEHIRELVRMIDGVDIVQSTVMASDGYVYASRDLVFRVVGQLIDMIASRYDGPLVPRTET